MSPELEKETRRRRIDPRLTAAGWRVAPFQEGQPLSVYGLDTAIEEFQTGAGPADYALSDGERLVAAIEAKKLTVGPAGVLTQAARYSRGLPAGGFPLPEGHRVPFLYSTNGERIMFHDVRYELIA